MSRIGKQPISLPSGVTCTIDGTSVSVKGPKGELKQAFHSAVRVLLESIDGTESIVLSVAHPEQVDERSVWGTTRAILSNMVEGVTKGFEKKLEVIGVGFRAQVSGNKLTLEVGYSHPVVFLVPEGIKATVADQIITLSGFDAQLIGETAAQIRAIRKPEPYNGTGIKYVDEVIRRKAGKAAKTAE
ncbi:50S ribosomal protein L6 [Candidatus Uhrbacteria bacterium]|nr:50S ribosomal protein L6 [Candidatus Uhrbacteria bacterium]